jgi:carbon monoxide dehydrogenase subunit G
MDIIGQQVIPASRDAVWKALNDPVVLKACLPGCESVEQTSPEEFRVAIKAVIGPLRARFQGVLKIAEAQPPESCVMHFEGQGGAIGFGKGSAQVRLRETPGGTELSYDAKALVGGKLAQVGSRLIDSVVKKMSDDFFKAFQLQLAPPAPVPAPAQAVAANAVAVVAVVEAGALSNAKANAKASGQGPAKDVVPHVAAPAGTVMVPGWWLAPAALLGALLVIAGARLLH